MAWSSTGVQSGTDTNLSGITAVTGVTVNVTSLGVKVYTVPSTVALLTITGTLSWNPDLECLVTSDSTRVEQNTGAIVTIGAESVVNGKTRVSRGTGLIMNRQQLAATSSTSASNWWIKDDAEFITYGGQIKTGGGFFVGSSTTPPRSGKVTINGNTEFFNLHNALIMQVFRSFSAAIGININSAILTGLKFGFIPFSTLGFNNLSAEMDFASFQSDGNGSRDPVTVPNAIFVNNKETRDYTYVAAANSLNNVNKYIFINPDVGSLLRTAGQSTSTWRIGCSEIFRNVKFNVQDSNSNPASDVIAYMALNGASINPLGRYAGIDDYITPRKYLSNTDIDGNTNTLQVLYAVAQAYATDSTDAGLPLTMESLTNRSNDVQVANIGGYSYLSSQVDIPMRGIDTNNVSWTVFADSNVTLDRSDALAKLASSFVIDTVAKTITVTANSNYDDLYDIAKAYKYNGIQSNVETPTIIDLIVKANGSVLDAYTGWDLIVNSGVTLDSGVKFDKIKFDSITNNGLITGVYQDITGTSTVLTISGFDAGSSVYLEDNFEVEKFYQTNVTDSEVVFYIPPTATGSWYYAVEKYGNQRQSDFFTFSGGFKDIVVKAIEDTGISELNESTVAAYTALENPDKIYDYVAYLRTTTPHISFGQIVFKDGTALDLLNSSMIVDQDSANVAVYDWDTKVLTIKTLVLDSGVKYNLIRATPPATVEAVTNEIINVLIEDANGDSKLNILGGDNLGYELWKVTTATATDDYATGTLLTTLPNNINGFRFIGITGFDIVGRDVSSGVRRRSSMLKGVYNQAFYVGDQIQLATNAPQLVENNQKLDELILKTDTNLDVKVSTRLATADYVAPNNAEISQIKAKVDTLENTDLTGIALEASVQEVLTTVENINVDFTPVLDAVDLTLKTSQYIAPDNGTISLINTKVDSLSTTAQLEAAKNEILANTSGATPEEIADQVWLEQPERLKNVSTVQITGEQLKIYIDQ